MRSNVRDFVSSFKKDLARPSRFDVQIPIPILLAPFYKDTAKTLNYRCEVTELPGRTFATTERKIGSVPIQKMPYQTTYEDVQMTFIVGGDMNERMFFDQWMELINPNYSYNFRYKNQYATDIAINQYDMKNNLIYKSVLIDAFPLAVNQLDLDWTADNYHRLTVLFAYSKWEEGTVTEISRNIVTQTISGIFD